MTKKPSINLFFLSTWGLCLTFAGILVALITTPVQAAELIWESSGDVEIIDPNNLQLSTDGLFDDDFDLGADNGDFNFSGDPATGVGFGGLEDFLGVDVTDLDLEGFAFEGSAIKTNLNLSSRTEVSFDWEFLTNETSNALSLSGGPFNDYGFFFLGQKITKLADWTNANQTNCYLGFDRCTETGNKTRTLDPGSYTLGFGVIDIDDVVVTSALRISSFTLTPISQPPATVPEPNLILGLFATVGLGANFWGKKPKQTLEGANLRSNQI